MASENSSSMYMASDLLLRKACGWKALLASWDTVKHLCG